MSELLRETPMQTMENSIIENAVELDWYCPKVETIRVTARNQQRFEIQKDKAIDVLRVAVDREQMFRKQFELLLDQLGQWMKEFCDEVEKAFLTLQEAALQFAVVRKTAKYNEELEDSLYSLELKLSHDKDLDLVKIGTVCLPPVSDESLMSFLDKRMVFVFHGKSR